MTEEEALNIYDKMVKEYGDKLPNPFHEPIRFGYFVKLFKRYDYAKYESKN